MAPTHAVVIAGGGPTGLMLAGELAAARVGVAIVARGAGQEPPGSRGAEYLVGCDGGRSLVRKQAGIAFPGWDPSVSYLIAEVEMTGEPPWGMRRGDKGIHGISKHEDGKRVRVLLTEENVGQG